MFILRALLVFFGAIFGGFGLHAALMKLFGVERDSQIVITASFFICCGVVFVVALRLTRFMKPQPEPVMSEAELQRLGLLTEETYEAKRALTVEEFEDEGPHVFLELVDGRVLYLTGQYLEECVYGWTGGIQKKAPTFPCSQFRVKRRKDGKWVYCYHILPLSPYVAPEVAFPSFQPGEVEALGEPLDGGILDKSFDELKTFLANRKRR